MEPKLVKLLTAIMTRKLQRALIDKERAENTLRRLVDDLAAPHETAAGRQRVRNEVARLRLN